MPRLPRANASNARVVGDTAACPELGKTNIASAPEYQNSVAPSMRYVPLNCLPPGEEPPF
jgi:hypothetical protein